MPAGGKLARAALLRGCCGLKREGALCPRARFGARWPVGRVLGERAALSNAERGCTRIVLALRRGTRTGAREGARQGEGVTFGNG